MNLKQLIRRFQTKTLLIAVVVALLVLNIGRFAISYFNDQQEQVLNKIDMLEQYQDSIQDLSQLKNKVATLERQKQLLDNYFFTGTSEEDVSSKMQIQLQEMVINANLEPEFLRPVHHSDVGKGKEFDEIAINLRMSGTLEGFEAFLRNLYKSKNLFKIESFTLKPYKNTELKIVLEIKGYYKLSTSG